jgi:hypothetical protein
MTVFDKKIFDSLVNNSFLFLSEALKRLLDKDKKEIEEIDIDLLTLTCAELQISLELAVRATLVYYEGVRSVLVNKQKELKELDLVQLFTKNTLKVEDFDKQKNYLKSKNLTRLTKQEFKEIDRFQTYRNKIVHFTCSFDDAELTTLRDDLLYYIIHVILVLLTDVTTGETPTEILESKLGYWVYDKLKTYQPYVNAMEQYAQKYAQTAWTCVICSHRTFVPEDDICYCCGYESPSVFNRVDCAFCGTKRSVIYDNLNIHNEKNHHTMPGFCMNCGENTFVFECPKCGEAHDIELNLSGDYCSEGQCINEITEA